MATYAYVRVSTREQNLDRQIVEVSPLVDSDKYIYADKMSGKNFNRTNYKKLIKKLKKGDLLIIKSIDRLGRDYDMIIEEWTRITKTIGADIKVIDMPLLDTSGGGDETKGLIGKFISNIVLQILSFVAQQEREALKQRQAEGIKVAKAKGVKFGRPKITLPSNFEEVASQFLNHELKNREACKLCNMTRGTFYRYLGFYVEERNKNLCATQQ